MTEKALRIEMAVVAAAFLAAVGTAATFPAWAGGDRYPQQSESSFVSECVRASSDNGRQFCACMFDHLRQTVSYDEFRQMDREYASGSPSDVTKSRMRQTADMCRNRS